MTQQEMDDLEREAVLARAAQARVAREKDQTATRRETELVPLWERIKIRSLQNGFGDDYELALTRKKPA